MVELIYRTPNPELLMERVARVSTGTKSKSVENINIYERDVQVVKNAEEFIRKLVKKGHLSIGRFCNAIFYIECSRCCANQLVRSKFIDVCQESQRYVKFDITKTDFADAFIIPKDILDDRTNTNFLCVLEEIEGCYEDLLENNNIPKENARYILPNATITKLYIISSFQGWVDFCTLRDQPEAQWEIREIANEIFEILCKECPSFFEYFRKKQEKSEKEKLLEELIDEVKEWSPIFREVPQEDLPGCKVGFLKYLEHKKEEVQEKEKKKFEKSGKVKRKMWQ